MPNNTRVLDLLKSNTFHDYLQSSSSVRTHSFLKGSTLSFSKKLRSKINKMVYLFLVALKNRLFCIGKFVVTRSRYSTILSTTQLSKHGVLYTIPDLALAISCRQTVQYLIRIHKSVLDFYRVRLHIYFVFWNLVFSVIVAKPNNISLPRTRNLKTVLRSPHIDKRSREQFEKVEHRSLMLLPSYLSNLSYVINYVVPTFGVQVTQHQVLKR